MNIIISLNFHLQTKLLFTSLQLGIVVQVTLTWYCCSCHFNLVEFMSLKKISPIGPHIIPVKQARGYKTNDQAQYS